MQDKERATSSRRGIVNIYRNRSRMPAFSPLFSKFSIPILILILIPILIFILSLPLCSQAQYQGQEQAQGQSQGYTQRYTQGYTQSQDQRQRPMKDQVVYPTKYTGHIIGNRLAADSPPHISSGFYSTIYAPTDSAKPRFSSHQLLFPGVLIGTGISLDLIQGSKNTQLSLHQKNMAGFHTTADNILLYVPAIFPYAMDLLGVPSKTDIANRTAILLKAEALVITTGILLKHSVREWRPDKSNAFSFPSGHTMQVFATATMVSQEYKSRYKWMPYAAYGLASGVGLFRLANNRHYLGDVLAGAGLGILCMKLSYWTHRYQWNRHNDRRRHRNRD